MLVWNNVTIKIRTSVLLREINLSISNGEILGITGSNGSGKTILAFAIADEMDVSGDFTSDGGFIKKQFVPFYSSLSLSKGKYHIGKIRRLMS